MYFAKAKGYGVCVTENIRLAHMVSSESDMYRQADGRRYPIRFT